MLAFSNDYYGFIFRATQSVEVFCAYEERHEWGGGDITELNQDVVDTFVEKIVVWDEKNVEIRWKFRRDVA